MAVTHERLGPISVITLCRPTKRNAVNAELAAGLDRALNDFEDEPDQRVAILTGGPRVFCAGTDLRDGPGEPSARGGEYGIARRRRTKPLIAAVEGVAYGGGFEIVMTCDLVVASATARFALPEVKRGLVANTGALFRTTRLVPPNVAKELLLTGEPIDATEAHRLGFVNRVVPEAEALAGAIALAESIAANGPLAVSQTLQAIDATLAADDEAGWAATARTQEVILGSDDLREGIDAFFEGRPPVWRGR